MELIKLCWEAGYSNMNCFSDSCTPFSWSLKRYLCI
ncbi:hypothetical protein CR513_14398, partial [Mucuna pruriens]